MKKITLVFVALGFLIMSNASAQDCFKYFPANKGTVLEYTDFDKKGKIQSTTVRTVVDKRTSNGEEFVDYRVETSPVDADTTFVQEFTVSCKDGVVSVDMSNYFATDTSAYEGMEIEITGDNIDFPSNAHAGQTLDDSEMNIAISNNGAVFMSIDSKISNRKVEAIENVRTSAGKFETIKITYDITVKMGFINTKASAVEWYSEKYGLIKTENYNKKGKLESYTELTKIISE